MIIFYFIFPGIFRKPKSETCFFSTFSGASVVTSYTSFKVRFMEIFYTDPSNICYFFYCLEEFVNFIKGIHVLVFTSSLE